MAKKRLHTGIWLSSKWDKENHLLFWCQSHTSMACRTIQHHELANHPRPWKIQTLNPATIKLPGRWEQHKSLVNSLKEKTLCWLGCHQPFHSSRWCSVLHKDTLAASSHLYNRNKPHLMKTSAKQRCLLFTDMINTSFTEVKLRIVLRIVTGLSHLQKVHMVQKTSNP